MTIDEAIKHAEEVAEEQEKLYRLCPVTDYGCKGDKHCKSMNYKYDGCLKCAEEHRQLAEWLKDYKRLLEQEPKWIPVSERLPEKNVWVLVTVVQGSGWYVEIMRIDKYKGMFTDNIDYYDSIIAWMPLPKPYEPQESEE